jgi:pimeloyl-ACP methyl ester carboxylesterase
MHTRGSIVAILVFALSAAACGSSNQPAPTTNAAPPLTTRAPAAAPAPSTTVAPSSPSTTGEATSGTVPTTVGNPALAVTTVRDLVYRKSGDPSLVDVYFPDGAEGLPAVVLLHGYTRPGASSELFPLAPLAEEIAQLGAVVFYFKWYTRGQYSSRSVDDLVCIGSFVQARASDHGARSDRVVVIGHSMGAEVGVNLAFRSFDLPEDPACVETGSQPTVDAFVGIAGDYSSLGIPVDADREAFRYPSRCFDGPEELDGTEFFKPYLTAQEAFTPAESKSN